jgi:hypothetical protein
VYTEREREKEEETANRRGAPRRIQQERTLPLEKQKILQREKKDDQSRSISGFLFRKHI